MHPVPPPSVTDGGYAVPSHQRVALPIWFLAIYRVAVDKGGISALALTRELGISYPTAWLMHHKIPHAMADRNGRYQLGGLVVEWNDAYFGGVSHVPGKRGRGTDQDPVIVGVSLTEHVHPRFAFLEVVESVQKETVLEVLHRRVDRYGVWLSDGSDIYASNAWRPVNSLPISRFFKSPPSLQSPAHHGPSAPRKSPRALTPTRSTPLSPHSHPKSGVLCGSAHSPRLPGVGALCAPQPLGPCSGFFLPSIYLTQWQTEPHNKSLHAPASDESCEDCGPRLPGL